MVSALLFVTATLSLAVIVLSVRGELSFRLAPYAAVLAVWDTLLAAGLLSVSDRWRRLAIVRGFCGLLAPPLLMLPPVLPPSVLIGAILLTHSVGLLALLLGREPHRSRVLIGEIMVGLSVIAFVSLLANAALREHRIRGEIQQYALEGSRVVDEDLGFEITLPGEWILLRLDNPVIPAEGAKLVAAELKTNCFAKLAVEFIPEEVTSLDEYLDLFVAERKKLHSSFTEMRRSDARLGNRPSRRSEVRWEEQGLVFEGQRSVTRDGWNYFSMTGWTSQESADGAMESLGQLQKELHTKGKFVGGLVLEIRGQHPFISERSARLVVDTAIERELRLSQVTPLLQEMVRKGTSRLTHQERLAIETFFAKTVELLAGRELDAVSGYFGKLDANQEVSRSETRTAWALIWKGMLKLSTADRERFTILYNKAIEGGLQ